MDFCNFSHRLSWFMQSLYLHSWW